MLPLIVMHPIFLKKFFAKCFCLDLTVHYGASLNYEALTAYNYTIYVAVSDGIFSDASYLTISVLDENEPPNVNLDTYYITVDEGQV